MHHLQNTKVVNIAPPAAILDNASAVTVELDTIGFGELTVICALGATDIAAVALKLQESNAAGSGQADITGLIWGTSNDIAGAVSTLPSATNDDGVFIFDVDLRGRKRYITLVFTAGNGTLGTYFSAIAVLGRAAYGITTAAQRGAVQVLRA